MLSVLRFPLLAICCLAAAVLSGSFSGESRAQQAGAKEKRIALVIGNSAYRNVGKLSNPTNDAADIAKKLQSLQFEVILVTDADRAAMRSALEQFQSRLTRDHTALLFFAGHGVTVNSESFLLPVDVPAEIQFDDSSPATLEGVNSHLVSMASVLEPLTQSRVGIVFLDACRTNASDAGAGLRFRMVSLGTKRAVPIMRGTGSLQVKPSPYSAGVFRAYATQLENVASDGEGRNSPFTRALLKHIDTRGISIQELMIRVRKSVMEETKSLQVPWEEAALNESFYFLPPVIEKAAPRPQSAPATAARPGNNLPPNLGIGVGGGL